MCPKAFFCGLRLFPTVSPANFLLFYFCVPLRSGLFWLFRLCAGIPLRWNYVPLTARKQHRRRRCHTKSLQRRAQAKKTNEALHGLKRKLNKNVVSLVANMENVLSFIASFHHRHKHHSD